MSSRREKGHIVRVGVGKARGSLIEREGKERKKRYKQRDEKN